MEKVKYTFSFSGVSATMLFKGLYLNAMKEKQDLKNF